MATIPNFPHHLLDEHHAWHQPGSHPGLPTRRHPAGSPHSGEEFLTFHRDLMFRFHQWFDSQSFASQFDVVPWDSVPGALKDANLGWTAGWANDERRLSGGSQFASEDELGIFIELGIHNQFLHGAAARAFSEPTVGTFHSPQSTLFYKIHGLVQRWWDLWIEKRHAEDRRAFSASYYLGTYGDLRNAFGGDSAKARDHWTRHGFFERRRSAAHYDVDFYLSGHSDLVAAFGTNGAARAVSHWIRHGISEGRRSSFIFDVSWYLNNHPDLVAAFGPSNFPAALEHWLNHGLSEGRRASADFDVAFYLGSNPDLVAAFGASNFEAAAAHWMEFGRHEGRRPIP